MPTFEITNIFRETHDVKTFRLRAVDGHKIRFIPGQYCLVALLSKGFEGEKKPFTFSSSPEKDYIELTVKKIGDFTSEMHKLSIGAKLEIEGPLGRAYNFNETERSIVFLAGGSGITPFMSIIRYVVDKNYATRLLLLFANQTEEDIIYRKEYDRIKREHSNIKVVYIVSNDQRWQGEKGFISKEIVEKYINLSTPHFWYVCGPPPFNRAMQSLLAGLKIDEKYIKLESWQLPGKSG